MSFKDKLYNILDELQKYKGSPNSLMAKCVEQRLNTALEVYIDSIDKSCQYLMHKDDVKVLKKLNRGK